MGHIHQVGAMLGSMEHKWESAAKLLIIVTRPGENFEKWCSTSLTQMSEWWTVLRVEVCHEMRGVVRFQRTTSALLRLISEDSRHMCACQLSYQAYLAAAGTVVMETTLPPAAAGQGSQCAWEASLVPQEHVHGEQGLWPGRDT